MARILNIETSTSVCSIAVAVDGKVIAIKESDNSYSHSEQITIFCQEVLQASKFELSDIDAVAVSMGPGSYTGLRIGVSTAKGFCYSLDVPLIAVSTIESMAYGISLLGNEKTYYSPMIDARRMEVYNAIYDSDFNEVLPIDARIIDSTSFEDVLSGNEVVFAGDGAKKCIEFLGQNKNAIFIDDFNPSSKYIAHLANEKFKKSEFADTAYFEPFYLKDFVAGIPKVKGLK